MLTIDTTNMCSHLRHKLFEGDGIWNLLSDYYCATNLALK